MSWHCGSVAAAVPTPFEMRCKRCAKCAQIHGQTSGGTWERPRVSSHGDRDCGGEGQGRGHPAPSPRWEPSPSKTAVFRAELPERGQEAPEPQAWPDSGLQNPGLAPGKWVMKGCLPGSVF